MVPARGAGAFAGRTGVDAAVRFAGRGGAARRRICRWDQVSAIDAGQHHAPARERQFRERVLLELDAGHRSAAGIDLEHPAGHDGHDRRHDEFETAV